MPQENEDDVLAALDAHTKSVMANLQAQGQSIEGLEKQLKAEAEYRIELERKMNALRFTGAYNGGPSNEADALPEFKSAIAVTLPQNAREAEKLSHQGYEQYKESFRKLVRRGPNSLNSDESKAMSIGADPDGGFLVPGEIGRQIITIEHENSVIRGLASNLVMGSDAAEFLVNTGRPSVGWVGEAQARSGTDTQQFGKKRFESKEIYANPAVTQKLLDDSVIEIEAFLAGEVGLDFAQEEDAKFIAGDGILTPRGFTTYDTAATSDAAGTRPFGTIEHIATGQAGAWPTTDVAIYDKLVDVVHSLRPRYRQRAEWVLGTAAISKLRKIKDGQNNPIWQTSMVAGQPDRLLGYPVREAEQMPVVGANSLSVAFADWKRAYWVVDRTGVRLLRDPYTNKPYVHFYTTKRMAGGVADSCAIKLLKFAAA